MAIAIAMSSPITYCDFRDAETIMHDLRSVVYGSVHRDGKSNRLKRPSQSQIWYILLPTSIRLKNL